jgi:sulfate transport system permease protein
MIFIGFPFVVRAVQPVIRELSADVEEAAACLGATRWQTLRFVVFPSLLPSLLTGVIMAYGRAVGEYGSIIFISGNIPFKTEITPLMIVNRLEQYDYSGAAAIGFTMLAASLLIVVAGNYLQFWSSRFYKQP